MIGSFHSGNAGVCGFSLIFIAVTAVRKFSNILFHTAEVTGSNPVPPSDLSLEIQGFAGIKIFNFGLVFVGKPL